MVGFIVRIMMIAVSSSRIAHLVVGNVAAVVKKALFDCRKLNPSSKSVTIEVIKDLNWLEAGVELVQDIPNIFFVKQHV